MWNDACFSYFLHLSPDLAPLAMCDYHTFREEQEEGYKDRSVEQRIQAGEANEYS